MTVPTWNPKKQRFVDEYLADLNATRAAIRAGYSAKTAYSSGQRLLKSVDVAAAIAKGIAERSERTKITADLILQQLSDILTSDANGLVQFRRGCCRHCYGKGFRYQRTAGQRAAAYDAWESERDTMIAANKPLSKRLLKFDEQGGVGYNRNREPNPACPECFGDGEGKIHVPDTREIPPALRTLYRGVSVGKDGLKVLIADADKARELSMRHLGMLKDKLELTKPRARVKDFTGRKKSTDE